MGDSLTVCPLDFRYGSDEMKEIFSEEQRLQYLLSVEAALARAQARYGSIPKEAAEEITKRASPKVVSLSKVKEIESEIRHDVMAMVTALSEVCGEAGRYVHLGATSNDITDTATALQLKEAISIILKDLEEMQEALLLLAEKHRSTIMLGRTHGQAAIPITFGLKMAVYAMEVKRHIERLTEVEPRVCVGKMSGAVGTAAALGPHGLEIQNAVMEDLGLGVEEAATQIVGRDRYFEFISLMANIASSLEKFATEIRNLQRTEIAEVSEPFDPKRQVGSSTMAHKRNPIKSENICSLARIVRSFLIPSWENMVLWHERDLTNSASERFIIPHVCILLDDILRKMTDILLHLEVDSERMRRNLEAAGAEIMGESVMISLVSKGVPRQEAHEIIRRLAISSAETGESFKQLLLRSKDVREKLTAEEVEKALRPESYLGATQQIIDRILSICGRS